jgi:hypothetical protein
MIRMEISAQAGSVKRMAEVARSQAHAQSAAPINALCDAVDRLCAMAEALAEELVELRRLTAQQRP